MKKYLLLILAIAQINDLFGQGIHYQKTFAETLDLASKKHQPIFIFLTAKSLHIPDSVHVLLNGFESKKAVSYYNANFINYTVDLLDTAGLKIRNKFSADIFPAYIFLDSRGQIVYKAGGIYKSADKYIGFAKTALQRIKSGNTITHFEQLDKEGKLTTAVQIKEFINLRREINLPDDQILLDRYVANLAVKDLDDYNTILYILQAGPIAYGKTYNLIFANRKLIDSIFKKEPLATRTAINTRIITNTRNLAIKNKDAVMAQSSANYARATWNTDYKKAYKTYSAEMLIYYRAVKDTLNFFNMAGNYYDQYYLNISADSARKLSVYSPERINLSQKTLAPEKDNSAVISKPNGVVTTKHTNVVVTTHVIKASPYLTVATALNNVAWDFYVLGTHNRTHLLKALMWSKRAIELDPHYAFYDTMAHIMYRLNFLDEAFFNQQRAIDIAMAAPETPQTEVAHLKDELKKMKDLML